MFMSNTQTLMAPTISIKVFKLLQYKLHLYTGTTHPVAKYMVVNSKQVMRSN